MNDAKLKNRAAYEEDFCAWAKDQADLLRAGDVDLIDSEQLAEELDTMSGRERASLSSHLRNVMVHMLKMQFQPERRSRNWLLSIRNGRYGAGYIVGASPSLRGQLPDIIEKEYPRAREAAALQMRRRVRDLPPDPPFTQAQVLGDDVFEPDEAYRRSIEQ